MTQQTPRRLYIQEVSTRDGFQIESRIVPTAQKVELIDALSRTGLAKIEVTSFVSPKAIPALADAAEVMQQIERVPGVEFSALVANVRGCERALAARVDEINVVMSASQTHNRANLRMTCEQSFEAIRQIVQITRGQTAVNASISTAFGCPFEGDIPDVRVLELVGRLARLGIERIALCDTTGMANPVQVKRMGAAVVAGWPELTFTGHFHNTRAMGLANAVAALEAGIDHFDASLGGLGGCPFAPGATGNVCTEDLVHMFELMGFDTAVDLDALIGIALKLPALVGHEVPGQVMKAGKSNRRYPAPEVTGPRSVTADGKCDQRGPQ
jgi:hydroxymethylglutaryl-CoA lyase